MSPLGDPDLLRDIIRNNLLTSVFQPIVDIQRQQLFGYEALTRGPADSSLHSPLTLFDTASRHGLMAELEYACRETSCESFVRAEVEGKLFLNVSPMSLTENGYRMGMTQSIIARLGLPAERIVIELSEQYPLDDYALLREATDHFRSEGFQIAIDDLGAGYAGLRAWSELQPDFVKIDRHFIEHIHRDSVKREFVRSMQEIAKELDCMIVAEGIETREDLNVVQELGLQFGQGYYIGRPEISPENSDRVIDRIRSVSKPARRTLHRLTQTIEEITLTSPAISPRLSLSDVSDILQKSRDINCLPIVDDNQPLGMVNRQEILELISQRYTRELHGRKPIIEFMKADHIQVDHTSSLEEVSNLLTDNQQEQLTQDFIVTRDGQYYGIGKTSTLLRRITEQQIRNARYSNPLTMLPGNVPIHEKLDEMLRNNISFYLAYFDLNHFKPFNDHYGYSRGDDVIIALSQILVEQTDPQTDFVGHIGGDDFVVIFEHKQWRERCETIIEALSQRVPEFYCQDALMAGGLWGISRTGEELFFELLSLSVGVAYPDTKLCKSFHDVAALAVDAKKQAKRQPGNSIFLNRRRSPTKLHSPSQQPAA